MLNIPALLIAALILVESGGNNQAVGFDGLSFGPLQITDICRRDINRICKLKNLRDSSGNPLTFTRADCFDREKSIQMLTIYLSHYAPPARLGHEPTFEEIARIWNGGPSGHKKSCTSKYWKKVSKALSNPVLPLKM